jgi:hypothetical protein
MNESPSKVPDPDKARLRALVAEIDNDLACLTREAAAADHRSAIASLIVSWGSLVELLAIPPAPATRPCPRCGEVGMRTATRCGHCWLALPVPPPS